MLVDVPNRLEKIAIPQNRAILHDVLLCLLRFNGTCHHLHQKDAFSLSRARARVNLCYPFGYLLF